MVVPLQRGTRDLVSGCGLWRPSRDHLAHLRPVETSGSGWVWRPLLGYMYTRRCISHAYHQIHGMRPSERYDTVCTSRNRVQKEVPMGPLSKVRSESLLGVHSPDEVMTSLEGGESEDIRRSDI